MLKECSVPERSLVCFVFLWKLGIESSEQQHLNKIEMFCNIIDVFAVTFNEFNAHFGEN